MKLTRDNWIVLGILGVLTATYVLVVHRAQADAIEQTRARIAQQRRQLEDDTRKATCLPPMVRQIEDMKQRYNKDWDRRLPQGKELAGFLRELSSHLGEGKLANSVMQPGNPSRGALYNRLPINMKFEGEFADVAEFLQSVDGMTRLTRIEQLSITAHNDRPGLGVDLGMNIYFTEQ